jgi:uncharacterized membrane protein
MVENTVAPGDIGTFRFWMKVPSNMNPGTYREHFRPVVDGVTWMPDLGIYWDVRVLSEADRYQYSYVSQSGYPTLSVGDSHEFTLNIKNTGSITWNRSNVRLATDKGQDRTPAFSRGSGWISNNRIRLVQESVAPGQTGTFRFRIQVPSNMNPGTYREHFRPVVDGITWMQDMGIYWDVRVRSQQDDYFPCQWISQNGYPTLSRGQSYRFEVRFRNTGNRTWTQNTVRLATDKGQDRIPSFLREGDGPSGWLTGNRIQMVENTVAPGDIGTFRFWMKVPSNMNPGTYREHFRLVADGITWMQDWGLYWDVVVR